MNFNRAVSIIIVVALSLFLFYSRLPLYGLFIIIGSALFLAGILWKDRVLIIGGEIMNVVGAVLLVINSLA